MTTTSALTAQRTAALAHALSDETRLGIIVALRHGERCVCDLVTDLDAAQSRLSFHLRVLKDAGLVADRRDGRWSFYTLVPGAIDELHDALAGLRPVATLPILGSECCG